MVGVPAPQPMPMFAYHQQPMPMPMPMPGMFVQMQPLIRAQFIPQPSPVVVQEHHHHHEAAAKTETVVAVPPPPPAPLTMTEITETIRTVRRRRPAAVAQETIIEQTRPAQVKLIELF